MSEKYDSADLYSDQSEWSDVAKNKYWDAMSGLEDGQIAPLGAYIRAGYIIDGALARQILWAIEERAGYRFTLIGVKKGQRTASHRSAMYQRNLKIGIWVEKRLRLAAKGEFESVISAAITKFKVGRTVVTEAHALLKNHLAGDFGNLKNIPYIDLVTVHQEFPDDF